MQPFTTLTAIAAPLLDANLNTDLIITAERCVRAQREELGRYAFESLRYRRAGGELTAADENPDFVLNREPFRRAEILIAGENFGCGSSREMAVWALAGFGIRCVIAPSFGEIFRGNCFQNGVLAVQLPAESVMRIGRATPDDAAQATMTVDLRAQRVTLASGEVIAFEHDAYQREALLEGLDAIGMTMRRMTAIDAFQARDRQRRPWIYGAG
jgi:3-isopropylmalate/(R)-2-methylmalate dehydratase small subunit